jgi:hypothetical protein
MKHVHGRDCGLFHEHFAMPRTCLQRWRSILAYCQQAHSRHRFADSPTDFDSLTIFDSLYIFTSDMCFIQITTYLNCRRNPQHEVRGDYLRCSTARARQGQTLCMPVTLQLRDLPLSLDVQDTNVGGRCPACDARTPSNSSD